MAEGKKEAKLTDKQEAFCQEYLIDLNATQAAIRAGYSEVSAKEIACGLLTKHNIQTRVSDLKAVRSEKTNITAERILNEYAKIAFSDIRNFYNADGSLKLPKDIEDKDAACLAGIEADELFGVIPGSDGERGRIGETKKIKLYDKVRALDALGKHVGLFEKDNQQKKSEAVSPETLILIAEKINKNAK